MHNTHLPALSLAITNQKNKKKAEKLPPLIIFMSVKHNRFDYLCFLTGQVGKGWALNSLFTSACSLCVRWCCVNCYTDWIKANKYAINQTFNNASTDSKPKHGSLGSLYHISIWVFIYLFDLSQRADHFGVMFEKQIWNVSCFDLEIICWWSMHVVWVFLRFHAEMTKSFMMSKTTN